MESNDTLAARFATALSVKDSSGILALLHPEIHFRGMTPRQTWEPGDPQEVLSVLLDKWFEDSDEIEGVDRIEFGLSTGERTRRFSQISGHSRRRYGVDVG